MLSMHHMENKSIWMLKTSILSKAKIVSMITWKSGYWFYCDAFYVKWITSNFHWRLFLLIWISTILFVSHLFDSEMVQMINHRYWAHIVVQRYWEQLNHSAIISIWSFIAIKIAIIKVKMSFIFHFFHMNTDFSSSVHRI